jgi:hypothetical protein
MAVKLDSAGAALRIGVKRSTWYRYVGRPEMHVPEPDGRSRNGRPWWWDTTIDAWNDARPGPGYRSDRSLAS